MDISSFKKDSVVVHTIEKIDTAANVLRTVQLNYFYPYEEDALLTKQESTIIKYMANGIM